MHVQDKLNHIEKEVEDFAKASMLAMWHAVVCEQALLVHIEEILQLPP